MDVSLSLQLLVLEHQIDHPCSRVAQHSRAQLRAASSGFQQPGIALVLGAALGDAAVPAIWGGEGQRGDGMAGRRPR
jgi:hypothetical protein